MPTSLKPTERELLLSLYASGDNIAANLSDETGRSMRSISRATGALEKRGLIENKGRGVWTLTESGLETAEALSEVTESLG